MDNTEKGPRLTDEEFFNSCLNLQYEGLDEVARQAGAGNYREAREAFASYIKKSLKPDRFFMVPYEEPENVYKYPGESDQDACERVKSHVMISVGVPCDFGKEGRVDWYGNPTYNHYREWTWQLNRHHELKMLAHEYRKSGDLSYAETAASLFKSWVEQAVSPGDVCGYETDCWRTIECGIRMGANWPYVLHSFYETEAFDAYLLTDWYKSVWEHGDRLYRHRTHGNWLIMEMNGLAQIGILYPMFKESGKWLETAFSSLKEELDRQIYPDGFQYELSTGYHDVVINNYQRLIEVADAYGILIPEGMREKLLNACRIDIALMMPDGRLPDINDGKRERSRELLLPKKRILPENDEIEWVTSDRKSGKQPQFQSLPLIWSGFFVMRDGWEETSTWALFDAAPFGRGHQHEDKLSLLVYAGGRFLVTEGGNYAYDDSEMRKYVLSTRAHNTVLVDGNGQNRRKNYEWHEEDIQREAGMKWRVGQNSDYAEGFYQEGYGEEAEQSVTHNRCVYFIKKPPEGLKPFFLVVDRLETEKSMGKDGADEVRAEEISAGEMSTGKDSHTYKVLWHIDSPVISISEGCVDTEDMAVMISSQGGRMKVISGQESPVWQGFIATGTEQGLYRPVNCVTAKVTAGDCRIVTVLYPHVGKTNPICRVMAGENVRDTSLEITLADGRCISYNESILKKEDR